MSSAHTGRVRRKSMEEPERMSDLRIVLLGKTGAGKSASGNTIMGRETFEEDFSPQSVTRICQSAHTEVNGQKIYVIDTTGLSDTSTNTTSLQNKTEQIFDCTRDQDIDVFLLVIKLGDRYTQEEQDTVKWIQENYGTNALKYTIVLFTHGDNLHEPVERYLGKHEALRSVVQQCSGGHHVFNNTSENKAQVTELLRKTETLRMMNGSQKYTKQDYEKTQKERYEYEKTQKERYEYEKTQKERYEYEKTQKECYEYEKTQKERYGFSTEAAVVGGVAVGVLAAAAAGALLFLRK